jgi:hypothetical protein
MFPLALQHPQINGNAMANDCEKYGKIIGEENFSSSFFHCCFKTLNSQMKKTLFLVVFEVEKQAKAYRLNKSRRRETKD